MAEPEELGTDADDLDPGPDEGTAPGDGAPADPPDPAATAERFTDEAPADPNDPQYKYWQAAYTKTRQKDRERYGKVEGEHQQFGEVLRNFYQSDEYALQVLRQRFPQLANRLSLDGPPAAPPAAGTPSGRSTPSSGLVQALEQELGSDLAFLAPRLGPVLERAIQSGLAAAMAPHEHRTQQQQVAARKQTEDQLLAEMDSAHPGWEARYGDKMKQLDDFLNSEALTHPVFGNKYQLLYKLANPDVARIDATREMTTAARSRLTTGRSGRQSQPNVDEQITKARTNTDAFRLAAEAAIRELGRSA